LPSINQVHREWESQGVTTLLINIREERARVARTVADRGYLAPIVLDRDGAITQEYGIRATPTTFVIARDGTIVGRARGPRPWTGPDARALFRALIATPR
jgi:hypothetical protein